MAKPAISMQKVKDFCYSQFQDEEKFAVNMKLLRGVGLFAGSIFLMRNFGELMAI
ncbi:hypothetical protein AAC387_Pa03g3202 [Persea americana]